MPTYKIRLSCKICNRREDVQTYIPDEAKRFVVGCSQCKQKSFPVEGGNWRRNLYTHLKTGPDLYISISPPSP
jgi:transcription elongation factor Elf1